MMSTLKILEIHQDKNIKRNDNHKDSFSFPIWSRVAAPHKNVKEMNSTDDLGHSCIIRVIKTVREIMHNIRNYAVEKRVVPLEAD